MLRLEGAMGNVVNLNKFRKRKAKAERSKRAEVNRRLHGRTKAERARDELQKRQLQRQVDGARLERPPGDGDSADEPHPTRR
ncbi:MAG TPA: DUF4169 family protein [Polyangiaceae bacterium]